MLGHRGGGGAGAGAGAGSSFRRGAWLTVAGLSALAAVALLASTASRGGAAILGELNSGRGVDGNSARLALGAFFDEEAKRDDAVHRKAEWEANVRSDARLNAFHETFDGGERRAHAAVKKIIAKIFPPSVHARKRGGGAGKSARGGGTGEEKRVAVEQVGKKGAAKTMKTHRADPKEDDEKFPLSFDDEVTRRINHKDKVDIALYMESLCPGCRIYTDLVLVSLMEIPEFSDMVDLRVVPYGNGQLKGEEIVCQHGMDECIGNTVISCMQEHYPVTDADPKGFLDSLRCLVDVNNPDMPEIAAPRCSEKGGLSYDIVRECAYGEEGKKLSLAAARETEGLVPPHKYSPWVTMNGRPVLNAAWDLLPAVCGAYKGPKGKLCRQVEEQEREKALGKVGLHMLPGMAEGDGKDFTVCEKDGKTAPMP